MSKKLPYRLGAKPSRLDPRDRLFRDRVTPQRVAASKVTDRIFYTMVSPDFRLDQGGEGTCVGHAATNVLTAGPSEHDAYPRFATEEDAHQFARQLYLEASGDPTYQNGMYPRDAAAKLLEWGLIGAYYKITTVDELITAVLTHGPVSCSLPWYWSMFYNNRKLSRAYGSKWVKVNTNSDMVGYHEIAITGIDLAPDNGAPPFFRIENSWGHRWLDNGTARFEIEKFRFLNQFDNWTYDELAF